ncbi:dUTP diphosphatase [Streptomyces diacarni]|uniref:Deoxyuridine 5'-triphosphate nucleotidohydrolase n=1 Tax=Streptomyces diacarni TaxID=2800381 RepID=A0A367FEZ9_9ACTN|nr:dUTP diphosphatase [Streptomyces diacarni]RCG28851.1 dUTP diphosphatase [Streptomyces diacarni]
MPGADEVPGAVGGVRRPLEVLLRRTDPDVPLPSYQHPGDAGCDLVTTEAAELAPGERTVLPTGVSLALPDGYAAFVHPRSGLAARCGVALVNAPGTVDAGYRGEIKVIVANLDPRESVRFERFDRIAQLVVQQVEKVRFREVDQLPGSARAAGGFGSTGGHAARPAGRAAAAPEEPRDTPQTAAQQKDYVAVGADRASDLRGQ